MVRIPTLSVSCVLNALQYSNSALERTFYLSTGLYEAKYKSQLGRWIVCLFPWWARYGMVDYVSVFFLACD